LKTAKTYSLIIALLIVMLVAIVFLVNELAGFKHTFIDIVIMAALVAGGSFLIVRLFFIRYVAGKIEPILKTIHSYTTPQKKLREKIDKEDVISDLNQEVKIWADNQSEEIKKLRRLEKYRKDFLGNVSHELKTPIFNVQGYILTLLDGGMEDASINKLYLKRAENWCDGLYCKRSRRNGRRTLRLCGCRTGSGDPL